MSAIYNGIITAVDKFVPGKLRPLWNHPAGKRSYCTRIATSTAKSKILVLAGLKDISRPAEKLSLTQSTALAGTGVIWARYSLVIIPKNYSLFAVNCFVGMTGFYQLYRIWRYQASLKQLEAEGRVPETPPSSAG
ncbi:hypothetical protein BaRGS_00028595 [Batillaria attramentaria]|uniref:Mitochondrial pyruvate carrier n=1 Tax=Batillaria attramentaria TaxID=370345 RepID=A0ABD0JZQ3_9CAEN